jgi:hypothetical protein
MASVMHQNMASVAYLLIAWVLTTASVLFWLRRSSRSTHESSLPSNVSISARIFVVLGAFFCVFHLALGIPLELLALLSPVVLFLVVFSSTNSTPGAPGALDFSIWLMLFLPSFAIKQFVLGWRDIPSLIPEPEVPATTPKSDLNSIPTSKGRVVTQLKPYGKVEFCGQTYDAVSHDSQVIDNNAGVKACGSRGTLLIVREVEGTGA